MFTVRQAIICLFVIAPVAAKFEGDRCRVKKTGEKGKCVLLDDCEYAKGLLRSNQKPQHCGFKDQTPIVCCPISTRPVAGEVSNKMCEKYYPKPVNNFETFVFGGVKSLSKEFPHMAILGFGDKNNIQWLCGGSLISEDFVLTAAHCIISQEFGPVRWIRLGELDIKNTTDDAKPQDFGTADTYVHPEYRSSSHYHDIALIKLDRAAVFDSYVKPACLYTNWTISEQLIATGWGKLEFFGESSSHLMKVDLQFINNRVCARSYASASKIKLRNGIVDELQICAGDSDGKDTCPGDSGGPLQFQAAKPKHFYVVGVTSFGKACGVANSVGVYTRVAPYVDWIEDVVWPLK